MTAPSTDRLIVAATDLSPSADRAVEQAARLATGWNSKLCLLHVFNDSVWATLKALYEAEHWSGHEPTLAARDRLSRQARELALHYGIAVHAETRTGRATAAIVDFLRDQQAQLLVVGEHGEDWIDDTLIGGTALKVLERASIPVLLARRPVGAEFSTVLTATDFSDNASRAARHALELFPDARHYLLHAYWVGFESRLRIAGATDADIERYRDDERASAEERLRVQLAQLVPQPRHTRLLAHGPAAAVLLEHAMQMHADLIVIGKHGGAAPEERLLGSVTRNVLYHSACDVLLVP